MALDVDGFALLRAIARSPDVYPDIRAEAAKVGRALVVRQLKARTLSLRGLREIHDSLGADAFGLVIDGLTDAEVRNLVLRFDRHHPADKATQAGGLRRHLAGIASWIEPTRKPDQPVAPAPKTGADTPARSPRVLGTAAFRAVWDGKDRDGKDRDGKPGKDKRRKEA